MCNGSFHQLTFFEIFDLDQPGILQELAYGQTNAFAFLIQADNLDLNFFPNFENIFRVLNAFPRDLGKMDQPISAIDVDESTKVCQAGNATLAHCANG